MKIDNLNEKKIFIIKIESNNFLKYIIRGGKMGFNF